MFSAYIFGGRPPAEILVLEDIAVSPVEIRHSVEYSSVRLRGDFVDISDQFLSTDNAMGVYFSCMLAER